MGSTKRLTHGDSQATRYRPGFGNEGAELPAAGMQLHRGGGNVLVGAIGDVYEHLLATLGIEHLYRQPTGVSIKFQSGMKELERERIASNGRQRPKWEMEAARRTVEGEQGTHDLARLLALDGERHQGLKFLCANFELVVEVTFHLLSVPEAGAVLPLLEDAT